MSSLPPNIAARHEACQAAQRALRLEVARTQRKCKHERVLHADWKASDFFAPMQPCRLCLDCGYEEEVRWTSAFKVLTSEFIKKVPHSEIWKHRFPGAFCPADREANARKKAERR